jgi:hypothetical protein
MLAYLPSPTLLAVALVTVVVADACAPAILAPSSTVIVGAFFSGCLGMSCGTASLTISDLLLAVRTAHGDRKLRASSNLGKESGLMAESPSEEQQKVKSWTEVRSKHVPASLLQPDTRTEEVVSSRLEKHCEKCHKSIYLHTYIRAYLHASMQSCVTNELYTAYLNIH